MSYLFNIAEVKQDERVWARRLGRDARPHLVDSLAPFLARDLGSFASHRQVAYMIVVKDDVDQLLGPEASSRERFAAAIMAARMLCVLLDGKSSNPSGDAAAIVAAKCPKGKEVLALSLPWAKGLKALAERLVLARQGEYDRNLFAGLRRQIGNGEIRSDWD